MSVPYDSFETMEQQQKTNDKVSDDIMKLQEEIKLLKAQLERLVKPRRVSFIHECLTAIVVAFIKLWL